MLSLIIIHIVGLFLLTNLFVEGKPHNRIKYKLVLNELGFINKIIKFVRARALIT
jgi:hypothetical protein